MSNDALAPPRPAIFPNGLVGDIAYFIYLAAPYPNPTIALVGAIGFVAGLVGRAYNIRGTGLNQYLLVLAPTGTGKEAISSGISLLMTAAAKLVPNIRDFQGPGEIVSAPGLFKWLSRQPAVVSIISEFGEQLRIMALASPQHAMAGLMRVLLQLHSKSGFGQVFGAAAYSDPDKVVAPIESPSLTIIGEGVPESFYSQLDEKLIESGLLPRFLTFEAREPRPYANQRRLLQPPEPLVQTIATLVAQCSQQGQRLAAIEVRLTDEASALFDKFERYTTDGINNGPGEVSRQLFNRANLKALKLAAVVAVGRNPFDPLVTYDDGMWATCLVNNTTLELQAKFERGETGEVAGSEVKQQSEVTRIIREYTMKPFEEFSSYGVDDRMHRDGVFTQSYISRRVLKLPAFAKDRIGPTAALVRALKAFAEADEIREIPKLQLIQKYGKHPKAFAISNPTRFL